MHIDVRSDNAFARKVLVRVPVEEVRNELDRAFDRLGKRAKIAGFRPGKVPRTVLEARFGPGIKEDVANALINSAYSRALSSHSLQPVSRPSVIDQGEIASGSEFRFTIALDVRPQISAQSYSGLKVLWPAWQVTDREIDSEIERRRTNMARLSTAEGRGVRRGDTVQVELTVRDGDAVVLEEPGTLVQTIGDPMYAGLEALLEGVPVGESASGEVTYAANARAEALAGRTLSTVARVLAIMERTVPALSDELAREMGFAAGVDGMRSDLRAQLAKGREEYARNMARANLLQALIDGNPFEVPAGMVEQNLQLLMEEFKLQQAMRGVDPKSLSFSPDTVADLRRRAAFAAKGALLLESVSRLEALEVSDDDVEEKLAELAAQRGQSVEAIRGYFAKDDGISELKDRILEEKTLDWLLSRAEIEHAQVEEPKAAGSIEAAPPVAEAAPEAVSEAAPEAAAAEAVEAPKKKRSTKKAEAAAEVEAAAAPPAEPAADDAAVAEAPKKKRASKKKGEDAAE